MTTSPKEPGWLPGRPTQGRRATGARSSTERAVIFSRLAEALAQRPWQTLRREADADAVQGSGALAGFAKSLGVPAVRATPPPTPTRSGGTVYLMRDLANDALVGVLKLFRDRFELLEELAANGCLSNAGVQHITTYRLLELYRVELEDRRMGFAALMEPARGVEGMRWLERLARERSAEARADAVEAMRAIGAALCHMHLSLPRSERASTKLREHQNGVMLLNFEAGIEYLVRDGVPLDPADIDQMRLILELRGEEFMATEQPGVTAHNDAHPGNIFIIDGAVKSVTLIDTGSMVADASLGFAEPGTDYAYLRANILTLGEMAGLSAADVQVLQRAFLESYLASAELSEEQVQVSLDFHGARLLTQIIAAIGRGLGSNPRPALVHERLRIVRMLFDELGLRVPQALGLPAADDPVLTG